MNTTSTPRFSRVRSRRPPAHAGPVQYRSAEASAVAPASASIPALHASVRFGALLRTALVAAALIAGVAAWLIASGASQPAEPELAMLLRGMSVLKGLMAVAAFGLVWWRFGQSVTLRAAATYIVCTGVLWAATVLIWQLAFLGAAAVLFHAAGFVFLVLAWREGRAVLRFGRPAPNPSIERTSAGKLRLPTATARIERSAPENENRCARQQ